MWGQCVESLGGLSSLSPESVALCGVLGSEALARNHSSKLL